MEPCVVEVVQRKGERGEQWSAHSTDGEERVQPLSRVSKQSSAVGQVRTKRKLSLTHDADDVNELVGFFSGIAMEIFLIGADGTSRIKEAVVSDRPRAGVVFPFVLSVIGAPVYMYMVFYMYL